ncbi:hypothetical protein BKA62DRAFT_772977 [Auriculariales sp. MPI-PUGE-AT-0066]|nr:hypothetical protein BKA62DRAFT_772977 [Auriculariales sp. MPI-PUGE-AT-0066]
MVVDAYSPLTAEDVRSLRLFKYRHHRRVVWKHLLELVKLHNHLEVVVPMFKLLTVFEWHLDYYIPTQITEKLSGLSHLRTLFVKEKFGMSWHNEESKAEGIHLLEGRWVNFLDRSLYFLQGLRTLALDALYSSDGGPRGTRSNTLLQSHGDGSVIVTFFKAHPSIQSVDLRIPDSIVHAPSEDPIVE